MRVTEKTSCLPDPLVPLDTKERSRSSPGQRSKKSTSRSNGAIKGRCGLDQPSDSHHTNGPPSESNSVNIKPEAAIDSGSRDSRATSIDRFSDVSRHSNSSRGYLVRCFFKSGSSFILIMILFPLQCDSESEEIEKANNHQELRGHSPTGGNRAAEFVAPVKQRSFSPGHAGVANNSHNASSNSNTPTGENCNNLRWVGLSGSPRPATAVAPLGHLQVLLLQAPVFYFHLTSIVLITLEWTEASGLSTNGRRCWSKSRTTCSPFASATPASSCGRIST